MNDIADNDSMMSEEEYLWVSFSPDRDILESDVIARDANGLFPLQRAARSIRVSTLENLLRSSPRYCCFFTDGDSILHACLRSTAHSKEKFFTILKYYPDLFYHKDKNGLTAFMGLLMANVTYEYRGWDWDLLIEIITYDPTVVRTPYICPASLAFDNGDIAYVTMNNSLPLHRLATFSYTARNDSIDCLRLVLRLYPDAALARDGRSNLPYDYIREEYPLVSLVKRLILRANPAADIDRLRELNWEARRVGIFLGYHAVTNNGERSLLCRLRDENEDIFRYLIFML